MNATTPRRRRAAETTGVVILVDWFRSFADERPCRIARSSPAAIEMLRAHEFSVINQLWLEHDLGWTADSAPLTAMPVVAELVEAAEEGRPYPIEEILIHSANPAGATAMKVALRNAGYLVIRHYDLRTLRRSTSIWR